MTQHRCTYLFTKDVIDGFGENGLSHLFAVSIKQDVIAKLLGNRNPPFKDILQFLRCVDALLSVIFSSLIAVEYQLVFFLVPVIVLFLVDVFDFKVDVILNSSRGNQSIECQNNQITHRLDIGGSRFLLGEQRVGFLFKLLVRLHNVRP